MKKQILKSKLNSPLPLLVCSFLIPFGSFMVLPFMPLLLHNQGGFDMLTVGLIIGITNFIQYGGGFPASLAASGWGLRRSMTLALIVRTIGFAALALAYWYRPLMVFGLILISAGAALYLPANKAYLVTAVEPQRQAFWLAAGNAAINAGMALGPLLGVAFMDEWPGPLFVTVGVFFVLLTIAHWRWLDDRGLVTEPQPVIAGERVWLEALRLTRLPMLFNAIAYYLFFIFYNYLGPYIIAVHSARFFSHLLALNCALIFFIQPLTARIVVRMPFPNLLILGFALLAAGMAALGQPQKSFMIIGTVLITLAEILLFLKGDLEIMARLPHLPVVAFGCQRLSAGVGTLGSGLVGGLIYGQAQAQGDLSAYWFTIAGHGIVAILLALMLCSKGPANVELANSYRKRPSI